MGLHPWVVTTSTRLGAPCRGSPSLLRLMEASSPWDPRREACLSVRPIRSQGSGQDGADRPAVLDLQALPPGDLQAAGVEAEEMEDRGVDVGDVVTILDGVKAQLVGGAVDDTAPDAA